VQGRAATEVVVDPEDVGGGDPGPCVVELGDVIELDGAPDGEGRRLGGGTLREQRLVERGGLGEGEGAGGEARCRIAARCVDSAVPMLPKTTDGYLAANAA